MVGPSSRIGSVSYKLRTIIVKTATVICLGIPETRHRELAILFIIDYSKQWD